MKPILIPSVTLLLGLVAGWWLFTSPPVDQGSNDASTSDDILYWVAPMDSAYRRDGPGKSPMGMDLVPVYASDTAQQPGDVTISPTVENNLGVTRALAKKRPLIDNIKSVGFVALNEDAIVHVHPRVKGWIETLTVTTEGETVTANRPLYTLYSPELVAAQEELVLALRRNNTALVNAAKSRLDALNMPAKYISAIEAGKPVAQKISFPVPQTGIVTTLNVRPGFYVEPGTTLLAIGNLSQVWVTTEVFERQASLIEPGQKATVTFDALPGQKWQADIDYVYPIIDAATRSLKVRLRIPNPDGVLKPNMFASVTFTPTTSEDVLTIPRNALIRTADNNRVVVAHDNNTFRSTRVEVGQITTNFVQILAGLKEGDEVVTNAQFLLDSESAIDADLSRISSPEPAISGAQSTWVEATIESLDEDQRSITASHAPIEDWGWPTMTMDFNVSNDVDLTPLYAGLTLHVEITKHEDNKVEITGTHIMDDMADMAQSEDIQQATVDGVIKNIDIENRIATIARGPIEKWNRGPATLDFILASDIDINALSVGQAIRFTFEIRDDFVVTTLHSSDDPLQGHNMQSGEGHNHD